MAPKQPVTIGVLAHVGNGNLGDEAQFAALVANLRERIPDAEFVCLTLRPDDTLQSHGIPGFPIRRAFTPYVSKANTGTSDTVTNADRIRRALRRLPPLFRMLKRGRAAALAVREAILEIPFLFRACRRLSSMSLLVIAGSQQLSEIKGGAWWFPYTTFKWTLLARLRGVPVAIVSVGAGPLDSPLSRWFVRCTVVMATYASYRDETSRDCIRSLGIAEPGPFVPDLAFSFSSTQVDAAPTLPPIVAINPMPTFLWRDYEPETERALYANYADTLTEFAAWLIDREYRVAFFATQMGGDPRAIADILERLNARRPDTVKRGRAFIHAVAGFDDLLTVLRTACTVVATRFHAAVLGCYAGRPVIAIAAKSHTRDLMAQMGDAQYVVSAEGLRLEALQNAFLDLEQRRDEVMAGRPAKMENVHLKLAAQYDHLVGLARRSQLGTAQRAPKAARVA